MNKVLVIGSGGSGKTHVSTRIAQKLALPLFHLDEVFWGPEWKPNDRSSYRAEVARIVGGPSWVMDGNYSNTFDLRFPNADSIVFLDRSPLLCLLRVLRRRWKYSGQTRPSMTAGNTERLTWKFVSYILQYRRTRRPKILEWMKSAHHAKIVVLKSNAEIDRFINYR